MTNSTAPFTLRPIPAPVRFELYRVTAGRRVYLGDVADVVAGRRYVERSLPSCRFRLVMRVGPAQEPALILGMRPSFGAPPVGRVIAWRSGIFTAPQTLDGEGGVP